MASVYHNALNIWGEGMYQIVAPKSTIERNLNFSPIKPLLGHRCITHLWIYTSMVDQTRMANNNPLLLDAYSLSKTLHLNGTYSWYTFAENILSTKEIAEQNIEVANFNKEKWHFTKSLKKNIT